jgi:Ser/Thr protein kinase RdoA (MazF antagonist)
MAVNRPPLEAGKLGAPLALGRTAEVYAWGSGQVLKLFYDWMPAGAAEYEARLGRAVHAAGLPAPAVGELVQLDGRHGIVYERVDGPTLGSDLRRRPWRIDRAARLPAGLHAGMHTLAADSLPAQRQRLVEKIRSASPLPSDLKAAALAALEQLPDGDRICHGDFHPENVLLTQDGPVIIDWIDAACGNPLADVARTCLLIAGRPPTWGGLPIKIGYWGRRRFVALYLKYYFALQPGGQEPLSPERLLSEQLSRWEPLIAAGRLSEGIVEEDAWLLSLAGRVAG